MRTTSSRVVGAAQLVANTGTPAATAALALGFVFWVTPKFEASATLQLVENESVLTGALATAAQGGGSGLSMLASLTGQGIPLQTEIAVLSSRGLLEELVEELVEEIIL